MQGWESVPKWVIYALYVVDLPRMALGATIDLTQQVPGKINSSNNAIYNFLTPNALQRRLTKYNTALALKNDSYCSYKRGVVHFILGKYKEAIVDFNNSIEWSDLPSHAPYCYLGMIYMRMARYGDAVDSYTKALECFNEKTDSPTSEKVATSLRQKKRQISRFTHGVTKSFITKLNISDSLNVIEKQNRREQVEDYTDSIFATQFEDSDILNNRGLANMNIGNWEEAESDFKLAGEDRHQYVLNRGTAHYYNNQASKAIEHFNRAIELAGEEAPAHYYVMLACANDNLYNAQGAEEARAIALQKDSKVELRPFHYKFLSNDLFTYILSYLDHFSLQKVAQTCHTVRDICDNPSLHTVLNLEPFYKIYIKSVRDMENWNGYINHMLAKNSIDTIITGGNYIFETIKGQKLKNITIRDFDNGFLTFLLTQNQCDLEQLSVYSSPVQALEEMMKPGKAANLKKLVLHNVYELHKDNLEIMLKEAGTNLKYLSVTSEIQDIDTLVAIYCPHLSKQKDENSVYQ
jgi:tetratricopeptide (TPR) repeat protein